MVTDDAGVLARTAMRLQRFPVREWEALREIIPFGVERRLNSVLEGEEELLGKDRLEDEPQSFREHFSVVYASNVRWVSCNNLSPPS